MAARLARAIRGGIDPDRTLCVTFTNRAAQEMRRRVEDELGDVARRVHVRTFHGLCAWMLRHDSRDLGIPQDSVIYDDEDCIELIGRIQKGIDGPVRSRRASELFFEIAGRKSNADGDELALDRIPPLYRRPTESDLRVVSDRYHGFLVEWHALDFADLVYRVRGLLRFLDARARYWEGRFDWIQVDEVQDTHWSEYEVLKRLAARTGNIALFGDVDQTIYEWRGSRPLEILDGFRRDFTSVRQHFLSLNYRATKELLRVADTFADTFADRKTDLVPHPSLPEGLPPLVRVLKTDDDEAQWIAAAVADALRQSPDERVGVLARGHARLETISRALAAAGVDHVTVEQFEFFRRQEVKDVLARARLILNSFDSGAARRLLLRPPSGVGGRSLDALAREGFPVGLRLADLFRVATHDRGEPFAALVDAIDDDAVVVFDVETTGLDPGQDEVIEIAATCVSRTGGGESFHAWVRPTRRVGESERIHGFSDAFLDEHGEDARDVFARFAAFVGDAHLVGHNVRFDLDLLRYHSRRIGVEIAERPFDDTLEIARRWVAAERFDLASLAARLELDARPTHRAEDDVRTTIELLRRLEPALRDGASARAGVIARHGAPFRALAEKIEQWRSAADATRPAALLERVVVESGLKALYASSRRRSGHVDDLVRFFHAQDRAELPARVALDDLVRTAALSRNVDHLDADDRRVPVVTVHQAKGLEFDTVFLAGLSDGEFPAHLAEREGRLEEERRLFYVALTRARKRLVLTAHEQGPFGFRRPSRFLSELGPTRA